MNQTGAVFMKGHLILTCRNWACHHRSDVGEKYIVDAHKDSSGNRIVAAKSCFIDCHQHYM